MKYYKDISQLPLFNYIQIQESNDLRYMIIGVDYFDLPVVKEKELSILLPAFESINNQVTDFMGINDNMLDVLRLERDIILLQIESIETDNNNLDTIIEIKKLELAQIKPQTKQSIEHCVIMIEDIMKIAIDTTKISVKKYLQYIQYITKKAV
jgi:hypothetical protein